MKAGSVPSTSTTDQYRRLSMTKNRSFHLEVLRDGTWEESLHGYNEAHLRSRGEAWQHLELIDDFKIVPNE